MKKHLLSLLWAITILSPSAQARVGWDNGNAGDTYTAEFILTGRDITERLKLLATSELDGIDLFALQGAIANTEVHSEEKLMLNGYEVDAINYPQKATILISRTRWRPLRAPSETKQRLTLVLHEYLFMIGKDDSRFQISGRLISLMDIKDYNPNRWLNPLNPANHLSIDLEYKPNNCRIKSTDFKLEANAEEIVIETEGSCGDAYREVTINKYSLTAPPSSQARGTFHRYEITVKDKNGESSTLNYEPEWGVCLLPQDGNCRLSGKISLGGVEFIFWLNRN